MSVSFGRTYLFDGDIDDVICVFGEPNPDEDDVEDRDTLAVWKTKTWMFYYTGSEYDTWEMPEGGPHEFLVSGDVKAFEAEVQKSHYCLKEKKCNHDLEMTIMHLVKEVKEQSTCEAHEAQLSVKRSSDGKRERR